MLQSFERLLSMFRRGPRCPDCRELLTETDDGYECDGCNDAAEYAAWLDLEKSVKNTTMPCLTCGGVAVLISHDMADARCATCGLVGFDVGMKDGAPFEACSKVTYDYRADRRAHPEKYPLTPDDVPF